MTLPMDLIRDLAVRRPGTPVLSVYVRTDPRDPANTATPAWVACGAAQRLAVRSAAPWKKLMRAASGSRYGTCANAWNAR